MQQNLCKAYAQYYIATCGLSDSTVFLLILSRKWHDYQEKELKIKFVF